MELDWFVGAARDRLIAWSADAIWLYRCSLSLPPRTIFSALKVLIININAWDNGIFISLKPVDTRPACLNVRRIILYTRRAQPPDHIVLEWTFFNRLMGFFNFPQGVTLELRGVQLISRSGFVGSDDIPSGFDNVILDENGAVSGMGENLFLDMQRALAVA